MSKTDATRCQILRLKCTKFDFSAPPEPLAVFNVFKGPTSKGREEKEGRGREGGAKVKGRGREGRVAPNWGVWIRQCPSLL